MGEQPERWAVVGGGILGMTLALRLRQQGRDVALFEAADHLGGLASAWRLGDITWDRHYHVTLLSDLHLRKLLEEIGLAEELEWVETKTGFYTEGRLHSMSNTLEFLKFPPLGLLDKVRLGGTIFYASKIKNWRRLERIHVADWLRRWSGKRTFEKIWLPLLRAKLGENYRQASASFIWAIIARMYAARRTGLKKEMFGYVRGGYARVLDRFAQVLEDRGVETCLASPVRRVESRDGEVELELVGGETSGFDRVVLTLPSPAAIRLCPGLAEGERRQHQGIRYQGIVCASVLLRKPLSPYYVTNITESWVPFTAVIEMSALVNPRELGGHALVYLPKYVDPDDPIFQENDASIEDRFLAALARMYPHFRREDVLAFRLSRVRHVLAIATLDYSQNLPPRQTSIPGVSIVNSAHIVNGTLNVNETIQLAEQAAQELLSLPGRPARAAAVVA